MDSLFSILSQNLEPVLASQLRSVLIFNPPSPLFQDLYVIFYNTDPQNCISYLCNDSGGVAVEVEYWRKGK